MFNNFFDQLRFYWEMLKQVSIQQKVLRGYIL